MVRCLTRVRYVHQSGRPLTALNLWVHALIRRTNTGAGLVGCADIPPCYRPGQSAHDEAEMSREGTMRSVRALVAAVLSLLAASNLALAAEKQGGILRVYHRDSPGSASIHEEATYSVNIPFMPVFNNLVIYKQDVPQNSLDSIVPDLAERWAWRDDKMIL